MRWQAQVKTHTNTQDAAKILGLTIGRMGTVGPCGCCGAEKRGGSDSRRPIGLRRDGLGWVCHVCHVGGDVVDLDASVVLGNVGRKLPPSDWQAVRARCASHGWC